MSPTRRREYTWFDARAVIGRAWMSVSPSSVQAHSTSCGDPARSATSRTAAAMSRTARSGSTSASVSRRSADASAPRMSTTKRDGTRVPPIRRSASPRTASMTTCRSPVTGSVLNATPEARDTAIRWTTTASSSAPGGTAWPGAARAVYRATDASHSDRCTRSTASRHAPSPSTLRIDSNCPANDRSRPSSATSDDRTATRPPRRRYARPISAASVAGSAAAPASTSRNARVVITKPSGTRKPAARRAARPAPLPPARLRRRAARSESQQMRLTFQWVPYRRSIAFENT